MNNEILIFNFKNYPVRTQYIDNQAWFCLKDVCAIFGLSNLTMIKRRLNPKGVNLIESLTKGGKQRLNYINESNIYRLAFRSDKPEAEPFIDWLAEDVLPSIRKTGAYICAGALQNSWEVSDADLIRVLHNWHHTKNKKETEEFRRLHAENDELRGRLNRISQALE